MKVNFFTEINDEGDQIDDDHVSAAQKCPSIRRRRIDASCARTGARRFRFQHLCLYQDIQDAQL